MQPQYKTLSQRLWEFHEGITQNQSRLGYFIWWFLGVCFLSLATFTLAFNTGLVARERIGGINLILTIVFTAHMFMRKRKQGQPLHTDVSTTTTAFS